MSLILALVMAAGLLPIIGAGAPQAQAADDIAEKHIEHFYYDPIDDVLLTGQAALDVMSDAGDGEYAGYAPTSGAIPHDQLDMSVYDVLNFRNRGSSFTMQGDAAVVSSAYEAVEFFMYRVMSGTGFRLLTLDPGVYMYIYEATFVPNVKLTTAQMNNDILLEMSGFIAAYIPHTSGGIGGNWEIENGFIVSYTLSIDCNHSMYERWIDEYNEAERLMTADVSHILDGLNGITTGNTINTGTDGEKLRKAYDYLARTVVYDLAAPRAGTAYGALINGRAVCGGYAFAYSMLCLRMGLNVPHMSGEVPAGLHAWNLNLTSYPTLLLTDPTWHLGNFYYNQPLDNYRTGSNKRIWSPYFESYIHFVNDWGNPNRNEHKLPGMVFGTPVPPGGEPVTEVIVHSTTPDTATINLTTERITLPTGYTVAAFSVDGGTKWRRGALPVATRFPRMLNKGMTLHVTDNWNQSAKRPGDGAQTITFPRIGERPKRNAERLVPSYGDSHWVLAKRNTTAAVFMGYEFAPSSNGRTPDNAQWFMMPEDGIPIVEGRNRPTFIVRAAPNGTTPASTVWRVRPANFSKAPTLSIRQAKVNGSADRVSVIAFRRGDQYAFGDGSFAAALTDKTTIPVSQLVAQGTELRVRRAATGRRPPSLTQTITLPAPAATTPASLDLPLSLEPFDEEAGML
jgi:hypothetical protein